MTSAPGNNDQYNAQQQQDAATNRAEDRTHDLLDEQDHERCSKGNRRALWAEKLESLRAMAKELRQDDWMFEADPLGNGAGAAISLAPTTLTSSDPSHL